MVWQVEVDVATARPPRAHRTAYVIVEAATRSEAEVTACLMVLVSREQVVMPVGTRSWMRPDLMQD
jgi:hypothetical protein